MNFSISNYWAILKLSHIELAIFKDVKDQKNRLKLCSKSSDKSHRNDCSAWYDHTPITFLKPIAGTPKSPQTFFINSVNIKVNVSKPTKDCSYEPDSKIYAASWIIVILKKVTFKTLSNI